VSEGDSPSLTAGLVRSDAKAQKIMKLVSRQSYACGTGRNNRLSSSHHPLV